MITTALLALLLAGPAAAAVRLGNDVVPTSETVTLTVDPRKDDYTGSVLVELDARKAPSFCA